jgi:Fe(3+) dicitrate transport protein
VSRISSVEVLKGPAAVAHGPHTVGGAVNMASLTIPSDTAGMLDISAGSDGFYKAQAAYGGMSGNFGYFFDVLTYGADGFKSVDGSNQPTGFERTDFGMKLLYQRPDLRADHLVTLLVEGGDEDADETYLGLADADFIGDPYRRYAASQLARFQSDHFNALLNYSFSLTESMRSNIKLYWNEFDRSWNKLDGFWAGPTLQKVLGAPQQYQRQYFVLTGQKRFRQSRR